MDEGVSKGVERSIRPVLTSEVARTTAVHINPTLLRELCAEHSITPEDLQATRIICTHDTELSSPLAPTNTLPPPSDTEFGALRITDAPAAPPASRQNIIKLSEPGIMRATMLGMRVRDNRYHETPNAALLDENVSSTLVHELMHLAYDLRRRAGWDIPLPLPSRIPPHIAKRHNYDLAKLSQRDWEEAAVQLRVNELFEALPQLSKLVTLELL